MRYVSLRSSFIYQRLLIAAVCFFANTSQPAFGAGTDQPEATPPEETQQNLEAYLLNDDEIAQRCATSIRIQYKLMDVTDSGGNHRQVTQCVLNYESMRDIARRYRAAQATAVQQLQAAQGKAGCDNGETANQAGCVAAGATMSDAAKTAHQVMADIADQAEQQLTLIAGDNSPGK